MSIIDLIFIAIGLAIDCFAVSIASSISYNHFNWPRIIRMALFFGVFQGLMPLSTWILGSAFAEQIKMIDHWLAVAILGFIGGKMIYESLQDEKETPVERSPYGSLLVLTQLAIATSIDAAATGLIFVPLKGFIWTAIAIIGLVSFLFTILGCTLGITVGKKMQRFNVEMLGGIILIIIGLKILIEHLIHGC
ncbi:MAG: manganese efflux pump MntP family protein [Bacteroidales bacterium]|nr:manganese efflux pump MntP family protein [Bacteroidales bacterium]